MSLKAWRERFWGAATEKHLTEYLEQHERLHEAMARKYFGPGMPFNVEPMPDPVPVNMRIALQMLRTTGENDMGDLSYHAAARFHALTDQLEQLIEDLEEGR